nr:hypothetical protein [Tanacetum cinerariifolium]
GEGSGSGLGCQETIGGVMAQIRSEGALIHFIDPPLSTGYTVRSGEDKMEHDIKLTDHVPQTPYDAPLLGGHTPGSDEGSMTLKELTNLYTTLLQKVLDLENVKTAQAKEIASLKMRVTKLEQRQSSRILGFHPFRAGTSKRYSLEMIVEDKGNGEKGGSIVETVSTARLDISVARPEVSTAEPKTHPTTTTLFDDEDVTIDDILVNMKNQKAKEKGIAFKDADDSTRRIRFITTLQLFQPLIQKIKIQAHLYEEAKTERERQEKASKAALAEMYDEVQAQIDVDHELAVRLTHEEQEKYTVEERSKLLAKFFERRKKQLAKERAKVEMIVEDKGNGEKGGSIVETVSTARLDISVARPEVSTAEPKTHPTTTTLFDDEDVTIDDILVNMKNQKAKEKGIAFKDADDSTRRIRFITTLQLFQPLIQKIKVGSEEDEMRIGSRKKRAAGSSSKHKSPKKQKVNDQESEDNDKEHRKCLKVVSDDDKAIDYETLDVKSPIVNCESQVLGTNEAGRPEDIGEIK